MTSILRVTLLLVLGVFSLLPARAQRTAGYGDWQLHLPTNQVRTIADAGDRLYVAGAASFFVFDKDLKTVQLLSRRDGLNDVGVRTVAYDSLTKQVIVAYASGTLDILRPDGRVVATIRDIQRKQIQGSKDIISISCANRRAYLATTFGVVVVDLQKLEIRDTYVNFGPGGTAPITYATTVLGDTLFAATNAGVLSGRLTDNLLDYKRWHGYRNLPAGSGDPYRTLVTHAGQVYAGRDFTELYRNTGNGVWTGLNFTGAQFRALRSSAAGLLVTESGRVTVLRNDGSVRTRLTPTLLTDAYEAVRAVSGPVYIGDNKNGLVEVNIDGQNAANYLANAPNTKQVFNILADARTNTVDIFTGGYNDNSNQTGNANGIYEYGPDGRWSTISSQVYGPTQFPQVNDLTRGARTPDGTLYIATYGSGLIRWRGPGKFKQFTQGSPANSLLTSAIATDPNYTRVTDVAVAPDGNLWVANRHPEFPTISGLLRYSPADSSWRRVPYHPNFDNMERLVVDDNNFIWIGMSRRISAFGAAAYDPATDQVRYFADANSLPSTLVYDVVKDRNGSIWVGTATGAAVFDSPIEVFTSTRTFRTPIVRRGTGSGFPVLYSDVVRCIAVDGGNRKWFGTDNGLWLFNPDADIALEHFTTDNSPLPSNKIVDVAVNDKTGEVWVGTDAGLVTYRGSATVTEGAPACAKVFPNPVRQDFSGQVGISGLANNAEVKITDVSGTLVYQTRANGGTVVWNMADYNGRRVQSGVYLVLTADAQGNNGCVAKVAVLSR